MSTDPATDLVDPDLTIAQQLAEYLTSDPDHNSVDDIVAATDLAPEDVRRVLDSWILDDTDPDGVRLSGEGRGGPWVILKDQ